MSQKTYLAPADQWDRTVALFLKHNRAYDFSPGEVDAGPAWRWDTGRWGLGWRRIEQIGNPALVGSTSRYLDTWDEWHLGQIVHPHRLFLPGDLVIISIHHGAMRRQTVCGFSSKGREVKRLYVQCDTCYHTKKPTWSPTYRPRLTQGQWQAMRDAKQEDTRPQGGWVGVYAKYINVDRGPLRFVEHPRELAGLPPDHAAVRRYAVDTLRAGEAATRVSADSPHLDLCSRGRGNG